MKNIILIGGGGHCISCIDVIESSKDFKIKGIVDSNKIHLSSIFNYPILGSDDDLGKLIDKYKTAIVTVGQIKTPDIRIRLYNQLIEFGAEVPFISSSTAYISRHAFVASGSMVMHGSVINANASIGNNCIINSQSLIEHDATVEDHCHIATGVKINGHAYIESGTFIGSGAIIKEGVRIGKRSVIGAGALVLKDIPQGALYLNNE